MIEVTGQILAGADPVDAVKYPILIMFLLAGATALGVLIAVFAAACASTGWCATSGESPIQSSTTFDALYLKIIIFLNNVARMRNV